MFEKQPARTSFQLNRLAWRVKKEHLKPPEWNKLKASRRQPVASLTTLIDTIVLYAYPQILLKSPILKRFMVHS